MWPTIWTIGHSVRPFDELVAVLDAYDIEHVADVRRFPGSRRLPQYSAPALEAALQPRGLSYQWFEALGGRRRPDPTSPSNAWRHPAFRAYAEHIQTESFAEGLFELLMVAQGLRTVVMCAEVLWWRCHRRLIADVLVVLELTVVHIVDAEKHELHRLTAPARLIGTELSYEAEATSE